MGGIDERWGDKGAQPSLRFAAADFAQVNKKLKKYVDRVGSSSTSSDAEEASAEVPTALPPGDIASPPPPLSAPAAGVVVGVDSAAAAKKRKKRNDANTHGIRKYDVTSRLAKSKMALTTGA